MTKPRRADDDAVVAVLGLDKTYASLLARRMVHNRLRTLTLPDPGAVDFSSNDYLSLSADPAVRERYMARLGQSQSPSPSPSQSPSSSAFSLGARGSRLLDGNSPLAESLERDIAAWHGAPAALLFNYGFEANTRLFGCAPQPGDVVVYDELIHASVHDGIRLGRATGLAFAHNRVVRGADGPPPGPAGVAASGLPSLEEVLCGLRQAEDEEEDEHEHEDDDTGRRSGNSGAVLAAGGCKQSRTQGTRSGTARRNIFVAVEAVYSMDGDVAPLKSLVDCVEACLPRGNGYIVVDEAHSTGWMGQGGRGLVSSLGLEDRIWARVHTFGKAMGCAGAAVLCSQTTRSYLINYARSLIYTTAMGFPVLVAIQTVYDHLATGRASPLQERLASLTALTHRLLVALADRHRHRHRPLLPRL
ncbi:hypothetical protein E4U41_005025, partial [Claviceps citrina]